MRWWRRRPYRLVREVLNRAGQHAGKRRVRGVLPGQVPGFSRPGYGGEHARQAMKL